MVSGSKKFPKEKSALGIKSLHAYTFMQAFDIKITKKNGKDKK